MSNKTIGWITYAQLISAVLITISHSFSSKISIPIWSGSVIFVCQNIGLSAFMFMSGYLTEETQQMEKYGYKHFVFRRAKRLCIPFVGMQIIMLLPKYFLDNNKANYTCDNIIHGFLFPREGILPHLWYLMTLFLLCLLVPLFSLLLISKMRSIIGIILLLGITYLPTVPNVVCINDVKLYAMWFFGGMLFSKSVGMVWLKRVGNKWLPVIFGILYIVFILVLGNNHIVLPLINLISLIALITMVIILPERKNIIKLGKYTFPIYILSLPIQNIFEILCYKSGQDFIVTFGIMLISGIFIPIIISAFLILINRKVNMSVFKVLIGL